MAKTYFIIPPEGVRDFASQYVLPRKWSQDDLQVITDADHSHFDLFREGAIGEGDIWDSDHPDLLGNYTLVTNALSLSERNYNDGDPRAELIPGYIRLAQLFHVDIESTDLDRAFRSPIRDSSRTDKDSSSEQ